MFNKILIANRGEIALRIIRACKELGIKTVAVYSEADSNSLHVRLADESVCIGAAPSRDSYLRMDNIISAADITGAEAIHPGFGFLSENHVFAQMVEEHGITFIGPKPEHVKIMGDKILAKDAMRALGVPLVPGSAGKVATFAEAKAVAPDIGYPMLIKAACGGGGKGMQIVHTEHQLERAVTVAQMEARANFGDSSVFIEKYLQNPRHIEIQILADQHGNCVHLGERDCSIQRRHQKIWEEAPSPVMTEEMREALGATCVNAMKGMGYRGVGTMEFLFEDGQFYFIEMNTRIQVEHPITEMVTGVDLIKEQIKVAAGQKLLFTQADIHLKGHAIECRINAEDPDTFMPSPGTITFYHPPGGLGVRIDSHIYDGYKIPSHYDSLLGKLIVWAPTRADCLNKLSSALDEYVIDGVKTLIPLHKRLTLHPAIIKGKFDIKWLETKFLV
ncbi:MAG: acetyl-CoA carboxylase biotin carboxylase subunit [Pseudomonadota bacterium]